MSPQPYYQDATMPHGYTLQDVQRFARTAAATVWYREYRLMLKERAAR